MKIKKAEDVILEKAKRVHMIGIGGSGMCPIAEILNSKGYILTGSDNNESDTLKRIRKLGINVFMGHNEKNVEGADLVIYSAAIDKQNPEIVAAQRLGIQTMERSHALGAITRKYDNVVGVCGTHGKTTVTSMLTHILYINDMDPTAVIGGRLPSINANGRAGKSEIMVCEACEFVDTFLQLSPDVSILLNIDNDHLDYFKTIENLTNSFAKFVFMSKKTLVNGDDSLIKNVVLEYTGDIITFGLDSCNDYTAENIINASFGKKFDVFLHGEKLITIEMQIPGIHNIYNGLAAFATAHNVFGLSPQAIKMAIESFCGPGRRFEKICAEKGITLVDDYAHHPTEIIATLTAAGQLGFNNVIAVFQPFTFSRTQLLKNEFIKALSLADKVVLTPIMGSREKNITGITSQDIAKELKDCVCVETFDDVANVVMEIAKPGDIVITMGGGDIYKAAYIIRERLTK